MVVDELYLKLDDSDTLKVTIWESIIKHKKVYHAKYINVNLEFYQRLGEQEKQNYYGIDYREEEGGPIIYYSNKNAFIAALDTAMRHGPRLQSHID